MQNLQDTPHRRQNILTGDWVLVSPHRTKRPWQGKVEEIKPLSTITHDPKCYLCPGNTRASGATTEKYTSTYAFTNDFSALLSETDIDTIENGHLKAKGEKGVCRVVCFSPNHSLTLPLMEITDIEAVIQLWQKEYADLGALDYINHVQIFENKGSIMGCSNPHPHGQIWAQASIPMEAQKKAIRQEAFYKETGKSLLGDYLAQEIELKERIVLENEHFVALVPFWVVWPYEAMIVPRKHQQHIGQMNLTERKAFAQILKALTIRFDNVFKTSFPYSSGIHQAPTNGEAHKHWHWHMSFYPPLLRSASVKKFMVGYEMFGEPQRDITAEWTADKLRSMPATHYTE